MSARPNRPAAVSFIVRFARAFSHSEYFAAGSEYFAASIVALAAFCLYLFCLAPSVATGGDCGELISASYNLGVAHPSGYALYCLAGKIFATLFPFGEIAWRYNLFSAVCGAATCGIVALLVSRLRPTHSLPDFWPPLGAGLLLAGLTFFGAQAVIAEVYAPTGLLVALAFLCAFNWNREPRLKHLALLAGVLGLSFNLHLSLVFLWPGLLAFFFLKRRKAQIAPRDSPAARRSTPLKALATFGICFLLGFSVTLYLPLRAATFPEPAKVAIGGHEYSWGQTLDWGHPVDFPRWKAHVLVQQYKSLLLQPAQFSVFGREFEGRAFVQTPQGALRQLGQLISFLALQFLWSTPLVLIGAIQSFRKGSTPGRALAALFAFTAASNVFIAIHYSVDNVFDIVNFLFPTYVVLAIWLGLGIRWLLKIAARWGEILDKGRKNSQWRWRFLTTAKLFLIGAILLQWTFFVMTASWKGNTRPLDATLLRAEAVENLQQKTGRAPSLLLFSDDALFPFWYAQTVLGKAKTARTPWGAAMHAYEEQKKLPQLARQLLKSGPVATTQWREELDAKFPYAPLTKTGNLWQLTTGVLPPPAQSTGEKSRLKSGVVRAKFLQKEIKRAELVGFQIDFALPIFPIQGLPPIDRVHQSTQVGLAEVLVAPRALALRPTSQQTNVLSGKRPQVWKQSRRLVVPAKAHPGQMLRATLPFEFTIDLAPGDYEVWTRIIPFMPSVEIDWTKAEPMRLIVR